MSTGFMISAPSSGSGKTVVTLVLLALLKRKGYAPAAFKAGPDYIDPMYHRAVTGEASHNLDTYLADEQTVETVFEKYSTGHDISVVEGAMGYYDGIGGSLADASAYDVARLLGLPVILVITSKGTALTDAAVIKGMKEFRPDSGIHGVILNKCSSRLFERMKPVLEKEAGIPVLGYLPSNADADFPSRHLGLCTAGEISDLQERIERLAALAEGTIDTEKILGMTRSCDLRYNTYLFEDVPVRHDPFKDNSSDDNSLDDNSSDDNSSHDRPLIAVARDESFCFTYDESIDILKEMGANISFFSPLHDIRLPEGADALYLPGGYPELYLEKLSGNEAMLNEIRLAAKDHMPIVAECGGYMYLCRGIMDDDGRCYKMAGLLPGILKKTSGLVRFGYASLQANEESLLFEKGDSIRIHSFHHFDPVSNEDDERGDAFSFCKASDKSEWKEGFAGSSLYAAFPHIYFPGCRKAVQRMIRAAIAFHKERKAQG